MTVAPRFQRCYAYVRRRNGHKTQCKRAHQLGSSYCHGHQQPRYPHPLVEMTYGTTPMPLDWLR